jgi:hypothetical protein
MFDLHNQRAALMPMMVGMMVCAVVVVWAAQDHKRLGRSLREVFLYSTRPPGVNEIGFALGSVWIR